MEQAKYPEMARRLLKYVNSESTTKLTSTRELLEKALSFVFPKRIVPEKPITSYMNSTQLDMKRRGVELELRCKTSQGCVNRQSASNNTPVQQQQYQQHPDLEIRNGRTLPTTVESRNEFLSENQYYALEKIMVPFY